MPTKAPVELDADLLDTTARFLKCLGHTLRLRILHLLDTRGECTVSEIQEALGIEQAIASQHLTNMWDKGVLARRKEGVYVLYSIADERALKVLSCVQSQVARSASS